MRRLSFSLAPVSRISALAGVIAVCLTLAETRAAVGQDGSLQTIRDDVRNGPPPDAAPSSDNSRDSSNEHDKGHGKSKDDCDDSLSLDALYGVGVALSSPFWVPAKLLDDDYNKSAYFLRFPYDDSSGYMTFDPSYNSRPWSVRVDIDYNTDFDKLDSFGGHLLVDTSTRLGFAASGSQLEERLPGGGHDRLWLGDANLVVRFGQSTWAEFRAGLGANWLTDSQDTNLGFNFTYGADFFPLKPLVVSTVLDWGTLGRAGLFRFRVTGGAVFHGVEVFTGYEYLDIDRTHSNTLMSGLRFWF